MIVGAQRWSDRGTWYRQDNDVLEEIRRKLGDTHVLQSCGSDAACSCIEASGWDLEGRLATHTPAGYKVPPDDLLTEYLNNPRNYRRLQVETGVDPTIEPNNRHAAMLPIAARELWAIPGVHITDLTMDKIISCLHAREAVQACLVPPGHYIAIVAYDPATKEIIYNDSWATRKPQWLGDGFNRRMTMDEQASIVSEGVVWLPPAGGV